MIFIGCYDENFEDDRELAIVEQLLIWLHGYTPKFGEVCYWHLLEEPLTDKQIEFIDSYGFLTYQIRTRHNKYELTISYNKIHKLS